MTFNWKKSAIIAIDTLLAVYLLLAITAFNRPDERASVCTQVKINISDGIVDGFLNADEVKYMLQQSKKYPLAQPMSDISTRSIEETLKQSPFVETAECYKTESGHICIDLTQRLPVVRVKAENGDDYYIDDEGRVMSNTRYVSDLVVATGHINRNYAQKVLTRIGNSIVHDKFWRNQIEQLHVLNDGSIEMVPRVGEHIIYLGAPSNIQRKLERLQKFYQYGLSQAGWNKYSYISLEFDNQIICKKKKEFVNM